MKLVSVIITNFNKEQFIEESIQSALALDYANKEVLIIDDGSTDNSVCIIEKYTETKGVRVLLQENKGVIKTRNRAINEAKGDYIVQLDGDDKIHRDFLKWTVPVLEKDDAIGIAYCKTSFFGAKSGVWEMGAFSVLKQLAENQIVVTALFKKSDFLLTDGYRDQFKDGLEDWDFWLSIIELGRKVSQIQKVGFYYRVLHNSRNCGYSKQKEFEIRQSIYKLHADLYISNGLDAANLLKEILTLQDEIKWLKLAKSSLEMRVGKFILKPIRLVQRLFSK